MCAIGLVVLSGCGGTGEPPTDTQKSAPLVYEQDQPSFYSEPWDLDQRQVSEDTPLDEILEDALAAEDANRSMQVVHPGLSAGQMTSTVVPLQSAYAATAFYWPLQTYQESSYWFGQYVSGKGYHLGQDVCGGAGTPVFAVANGRVVFAGSASGYGGVVVVEHVISRTPDVRVCTVYGHLRASDIKVRSGWDIGQGRLLGYLGTRSENGGWVPHLHYGVRKGKHPGYWVYQGYGSSAVLANWYNPRQYITSRLGKPYDPNPIPLWVTACNWFRLPKPYYQKYYFSAPVGSRRTVKVDAYSGDPDLYIAYDSSVSPTHYNLRSIHVGSDQIQFELSCQQVWVAVHAYSDTSYLVSLHE